MVSPSKSLGNTHLLERKIASSLTARIALRSCYLVRLHGTAGGLRLGTCDRYGRLHPLRLGNWRSYPEISLSGHSDDRDHNDTLQITIRDFCDIIRGCRCEGWKR